MIAYFRFQILKLFHIYVRVSVSIYIYIYLDISTLLAPWALNTSCRKNQLEMDHRQITTKKPDNSTRIEAEEQITEGNEEMETLKNRIKGHDLFRLLLEKHMDCLQVLAFLSLVSRKLNNQYFRYKKSGI